jgi:cobalt/nickel transport protein
MFFMIKALEKPGFRNIIIIVAVAALLVFSIFVSRGEDFEGTDGQAQKAIEELSPGYQPWFSSVWTPPGSEIESLLFALQAALGSGIIGYYFGYQRGRDKHREKDKECCK